MKVTFPLHTIIDSINGFVAFANAFKWLSSVFHTCFDETNFIFTDLRLHFLHFLGIRF